MARVHARANTLILVGCFIAIVIALVMSQAFRRVEATQGDAPVNQGRASLVLSPSQWASLGIETVRSVEFDSVVVADGVVAMNDNATVAVFSPFSGRITRVHAQLGQAVRKGEHLVSMLGVEAAQSSSDLATAAAAEATTLKQVELAELAEGRQHELLLEEAGTEKDWLQSQLDLTSARNGLRAAHTALAAANDKAAILGVGSSTSGTPVGEARIDAPIDGVVIQRQVGLGQFVSSLSSGGSAPLFTIADLHVVWVIANVREVDAARLKLGQSMEISALALPGRRLRARITWIASVVDPTTHRLLVRGELSNPDLALKPQMSITVRLPEGHATQGLAIPTTAIIHDGEDAHCYVALADRTVVPRNLVLGRAQGPLTEIVSGLGPGERVVTRGALFLDNAVGDHSP